MPKAPIPKPAPIGDVSRTQRAKAFLEKLQSENGKRLLVDLDAEAHTALNSLLQSGYGDTNKAVVSRALIAASKRSSSARKT